MKGALQKNLEYGEKYIQKIGNSVIPEMIKNLVFSSRNILDLGCGDGALIQAILKEFPNKKITGVDISPRRIDSLKKRFPKKTFICGDISHIRLKRGVFDLVLSTQVIEHIKDDKKMIEEMNKLLKKSGFLYVSSVIKKPWAIYKYRNKGRFVLDPTHEREYKSKEEFLSLFKNKFKLIKLKIYPVKRKKIFTIRIPGYYIIEALWKKRK